MDVIVMMKEVKKYKLLKTNRLMEIHLQVQEQTVQTDKLASATFLF